MGQVVARGEEGLVDLGGESLEVLVGQLVESLLSRGQLGVQVFPQRVHLAGQSLVPHPGGLVLAPDGTQVLNTTVLQGGDGV